MLLKKQEEDEDVRRHALRVPVARWSQWWWKRKEGGREERRESAGGWRLEKTFTFTIRSFRFDRPDVIWGVTW